MIRLGPAGSPTGNTFTGIKEVYDLGLKVMEVQFSHGIMMSNSLAENVGKEAKKYDIDLSIHAPFFINLASKEKKKAEDSKKRILRSCELGNLMNAKIVVFHPAYFGDLDKSKVKEMVFSACAELSEYIISKKWEVLLGLETTGKHSAFGNLEETIEVCKNVKGCAPVIDFAHIFARNYGTINYSEVFEKLEVLKLKHIHSHFSNIKYSSKGELSHLVLDHSPDFEPLAKEILKRKLDITIISESPITWKDSLKMKKIFEKLGYKDF